MITNLRNSNNSFKPGVEESIFSSALFDEIKSHLSEGLEIEIAELRQQLENIHDNEENAHLRMGIHLRILSNEKTMVEIYGREPELLILEHQKIALQYKNMKLYDQSYYHYIQAIHILKIHKESERGMESDKNRLEMELYVQVCKACCKLKSFREAQFYIEEYEKIDPSIKLYPDKNEDLDESSKSAKLYVETNKEDTLKINGIESNLKIAYLKGVIFYKLCQFKMSNLLMQQCKSHLDHLESDDDSSSDNHHSHQESDIRMHQAKKMGPKIKYYTVPEQKKYKFFKLKVLNYMFKIERKLRQYTDAFQVIEQIFSYVNEYRSEYSVKKGNYEIPFYGKPVEDKAGQNFEPGQKDECDNIIEKGRIFAIDVRFSLRKLVLMNLIKNRPSDTESEQTTAWLKHYDKDLAVFIQQFEDSDRSIKVLATQINEARLIDKVLQFLKACLSAIPLRTSAFMSNWDKDDQGSIKQLQRIVDCMEGILNILRDQISKDRLSYLVYLKALLILKTTPINIEDIKRELINSKKLARETNDHKLYHDAESLLVQIKDSPASLGVGYDQIEKAILMVQSH